MMFKLFEQTSLVLCPQVYVVCCGSYSLIQLVLAPVRYICRYEVGSYSLIQLVLAPVRYISRYEVGSYSLIQLVLAPVRYVDMKLVQDSLLYIQGYNPRTSFGVIFLILEQFHRFVLFSLSLFLLVIIVGSFTKRGHTTLIDRESQKI